MSLAVVILAAGKGTRMKSPYPKVLHLLAGEPLVVHVLEAVLPLGPESLLAVVGYKAELVEEALKDYAVKVVLQKEQLGTGDAVKRVRSHLQAFSGAVMVLCGDTPLLSTATLKRLWEFHREERATVTVLTARLDDPTGYGRIVRDERGLVQKIVEEKDASSVERKIREINSGTYVFEAGFLFEALQKIRPDNVQQEYYLTDVVELAVAAGQRVAALPVEDPTEILGINSQKELARVERLYQTRLREKFLAQGVSMVLPETVYLERRVRIGAGTILFPQVVLRGQTDIGEGCQVGSFCHLEDVEVGPGVVIEAGSILRGLRVPPGARVQGRFWR